VTTEYRNGHEWTLRSGYRRVGRFWRGYVYWNPGWVAQNLDGVPSRLVWRGHALTQAGIRRRLARLLRRERRRAHQRDEWFYRGKKAREALAGGNPE